MTWLRRLLGHGPTPHAETPPPVRELTARAAELLCDRVHGAAVDEAMDLGLRPALLFVGFAQGDQLHVTASFGRPGLEEMIGGERLSAVIFEAVHAELTRGVAKEMVRRARL